MRGPQPKDPSLRQRRNKVTSAATLPFEEEPRKGAPKLPRGREWHDMTKSWWRDVWRSPMASEFLTADTHSLYRLAVLVDDYWQKPSVYLAAEIRQQQTQFGLTPLDRRRLQWEVAKVEKVAPRRTERSAAPGSDPRELLRLA